MSACALRTTALLTAAATALLALPGCGVPEQGDPRPRVISPSSGLAGTPVAIRIEGDGLRPHVYADYGDGSRSFVESGWIAELGGSRLREVRATADGALQAIVPAMLPAGIHDLRVVSPSGREGILPAAYRALPPGGALGVAAFRFDLIGRQQVMKPFRITVTAVNADGNPVREFSGSVQVTSNAGAAFPMTLGPFAWGVFTGDVELRQVAAAAVLTASDGWGATGESAPFAVDPVPAARLAFTSAPLDFAAGSCTGPLEIALEDAFGFATLAVAPVPVTLSAAPSSFTFYAGAGCGGAVAQVTIPAGEGSASFWVRGTAAGPVNVTAAGAGVATPAVQAQTVRAGPLASFAWDVVASPVQRGVPFPITIWALDAFANPQTAYAGTADIAVVPVALGLACATGCSAWTTTGAFIAGEWSGTVQVQNSGTGAVLTAMAGAASGTSSPFDVVAAAGSGTPPTARFIVSPPLLAVGAATTFDATASSDPETPLASLQVSWDFLGTATGTPDGGAGWTSWSTTKTAPHSYGAVGTYSPRLAVRDGDGDVSYATRTVRVTASAADACVVDSSEDTDDGTGCSGVGGDGRLTLREAIKYGNGAPVTFAGPMTIRGAPLSFTQDVQVYAAAGVNVAAQLNIDANVVLSGFTKLKIDADPAAVVSSNGSLVVEDLWVHKSGRIELSGPLTIRRSLFQNCTSSCVHQESAQGTLTISDSEFLTGAGQGGTAIQHESCGGAGTSLDVTTTVFSGFQTAISVNCSGTAQTRVVNNTFHANRTGIAYAATPSTRHALRNNVFTSHGVDSVSCGGVDAGAWLARDHHLLFGNAADTCVSADPNTLTSSPQYLDAAGQDFRLTRGTSPAIDSGVDAGVDLNGPAPGTFNGAGPDRGGRETW